MIPYAIPHTFDLTGHRWRVKFVASINDGDTFGDCDNMTHVIRIAESVHGRATTTDERTQTFIHEFYHALLQTVGQDSESLVLTLENLTYQAIKTAKYRTANTRTDPPHDTPRTRPSAQHRNRRGTARPGAAIDEATDSAEPESDPTV